MQRSGAASFGGRSEKTSFCQPRQHGATMGQIQNSVPSGSNANEREPRARPNRRQSRRFRRTLEDVPDREDFAASSGGRSPRTFAEISMSRSYHVTRRGAIQALWDGDFVPTANVSEKAWVKKAESAARRCASSTGGRSKNSAIVSGQKKLTKRALRHCRGEVSL